MQRSYVPAITVLIIVLTAALTVSGANSRLADRGCYLVTRVAMCMDCHAATNSTTRGSSAPYLASGGDLSEWSDVRLARFLMTGVPENGRPPHRPMPSYRLDEDDARAVVAYLRTLSATK